MGENMKQEHTISKDRFNQESMYNIKGIRREIIKMSTNYIRELSDAEYVELDCMLAELYGYIKDEMIARNDFTKFTIEIRAMEYLGALFGSIKSFGKVAKQCNTKKGITVEINKTEKLNDEHLEKVYDVLKRYLVFVIKCFESTKEVTKDRVLNLSVAWLKDYLRIAAYKTSYMNI